MPELIADLTRARDKARRRLPRTKQALLKSMDKFTLAYFECALWSSTDNRDYSGGQPLDANYSITDFTLKGLLQGIEDCRAFQRDNAAALAEWPYSAEGAGHDFWLTRNGHGAGFWDRSTPSTKDLADSLTAASKAYGTVDLYVNRGLVHYY